MQLTKKAITGVMAVVLSVAFALAAATVAVPTASAAAISGTTTSFNKYMVMDENTVVPDITFTYSVKAGTAVAADDGDPEIRAGVDVDKVMIGSAVFSSTDTAIEGAIPSTASITVGAGQKAIVHSVDVDLSGVKFPTYGIYRYLITEEPGDGAIDGYSVGETTLTLDVYVSYDTATGQDKIDCIEHIFSLAGELSKKVDGFSGTYTTSDFSIKKIVAGSMGDQNMGFTFNVWIASSEETGVTQKYVVLHFDKDGAQIGDTVTISSGEANATEFKLKHGDYIKVCGLSPNDRINVAENDYSKEGYVTSRTLAGETITGANARKLSNHVMGASDTEVQFTNTKDVVTPTGIVVTYGPYVAAVAAAAVIAIVLLRRRRHAHEED